MTEATPEKDSGAMQSQSLNAGGPAGKSESAKKEDTSRTAGNTDSAGEKVVEAVEEGADRYSGSAYKGTISETQADAARLLNAEIAKNQARSTAFATGLQSHYDDMEDADAHYDEVRSSVGQDAVSYAYTALLNPKGMTSMSRQVDTSGTAGFTTTGAIAHAADVFGHPVQRTVAAMAYHAEAEPLTVVGGVPASDTYDAQDSAVQRISGKDKTSGRDKGQSNGGNGRHESKSDSNSK